MDNLIKALQIFRKYGNERWPTHCEHDVLHIMGYKENDISEEDKKELDELGFLWSEEDDGFISFKFGSA